jgi:hypothetical protein
MKTALIKNSILLKFSLLFTGIIFISVTTYGQTPGDFEVVNDLDCDAEVRLTLVDHTSGFCGTNCSYVWDTGWITISANSTHIEYGAGHSVSIWGKAEMRNPDWPGCLPNCDESIEVGGVCASGGRDGASCSSADVKITDDTCVKATLEYE